MIPGFFCMSIGRSIDRSIGDTTCAVPVNNSHVSPLQSPINYRLDDLYAKHVICICLI